MLQIQSPFQQFFDTEGNPLENGSIYIGTVNLNPETNPVTVYWDDAGTQPAAQPLKTSGGYIVRNGTPAIAYILSEDYSITVKDKRGGVVFTVLSATAQSNLAANLAASSGSSLVGFIQSGVGAIATTVQAKLRQNIDVRDFGAVGAGADESSAANAMITAFNVLYVPKNFTLVCKNIQLSDNTKVICDGTLKLPSNCSDFDRLLYANSKTSIEIKVNQIDGNYAGQVGSIGTHLVYLTNCSDLSVNIKYAHDHYISSGAPMPSVDGIRNTSSGAIFIYRANVADVNIGLIDGWGREAIYLEECVRSNLVLGHAQGSYFTEYSGVQVSGSYNSVTRASVDFAGASGVGFDTSYGSLSNVISTNTRENHGVNFGHTGFPASGSVATNIVVNGAFVDGIKVSAATVDLTIDNFSVNNAGRYGISVSDSSVRGKLTNGVVKNSGQSNIQVSATQVQSANLRKSDLDTQTLEVSTTSGLFQTGETITSGGGKSAVVTGALRNLSNTSQILFLTSVVGVFASPNTITGSTSGAIATVNTVTTPTELLEQTGGLLVEDVRYASGTQDQIRFPDGTAIMISGISLVFATGGVLQTLTTNYSSNVVWASAPKIVAQINSANNTSGYSVTQLQVNSTTTQFEIRLNASFAQTYGISCFAIGRWK